MTAINGRDLEQLSAYLDGELTQADRARLEARLARDPDLRDALAGLRQTRQLLRRTPQRRAPRNFTLTPRMAGLRPPTPRLVPAFSWASAAALLLFVCTLGAGLLPRFSFGAAPPAAAPLQAYSVNNTQAESATAVAPLLAAPTMVLPQATGAPTQEALATSSPPIGLGGGNNPSDQTQPSADATSEAMTKALETETLQPASVQAPTAGLRTVVQQPAPGLNRTVQPANPWPFIWLGLAILLAGAALLTRWLYARAFRRRTAGERKP